MSSTELAVIPTPASKILCAHQGEIRIEFDDDGNATITQRNRPDEDSVIHIARDNTQTFLDSICDAFGVPTFGGSR
jgi:hypothetical protein